MSQKKIQINITSKTERVRECAVICQTYHFWLSIFFNSLNNLSDFFSKSNWHL